MKITKERLMCIIKEEVSNAIAPNLEDAQRAVQEAGQYAEEVALYKHLERQGLDVEKVFNKIKKTPRDWEERTEEAKKLGINLEDSVEVRGYSVGRPEPSPIRPSAYNRSVSDLIVNAVEKRLLSPDEMEQLDMQITKARDAWKQAFDAQKKKRPHDPQAALRYGSTGKLGT